MSSSGLLLRGFVWTWPLRSGVFSVASGEVALVTLPRDAEPFLVDRPSAAPS
jgi:hypothetical protein